MKMWSHIYFVGRIIRVKYKIENIEWRSTIIDKNNKQNKLMKKQVFYTFHPTLAESKLID